jgi:hypothetical protein
MILMEFEKYLKPRIVERFSHTFSKYKNLKIKNLVTIGCDPNKEPFNLTLNHLNPLDTLTIMYKYQVKDFKKMTKKFVKADLRDPI